MVRQTHFRNSPSRSSFLLVPISFSRMHTLDHPLSPLPLPILSCSAEGGSSRARGGEEEVVRQPGHSGEAPGGKQEPDPPAQLPPDRRARSAGEGWGQGEVEKETEGSVLFLHLPPTTLLLHPLFIHPTSFHSLTLPSYSPPPPGPGPQHQRDPHPGVLQARRIRSREGLPRAAAGKGEPPSSHPPHHFSFLTYSLLLALVKLSLPFSPSLCFSQLSLPPPLPLSLSFPSSRLHRRRTLSQSRLRSSGPPCSPSRSRNRCSSQ